MSVTAVSPKPPAGIPCDNEQTGLEPERPANSIIRIATYAPERFRPSAQRRPAGQAPSGTSPPSHRLGLALVVIATAQLMVVLDAMQAWLLAARAIQGAGAAIIAPTALSVHVHDTLFEVSSDRYA